MRTTILSVLLLFISLITQAKSKIEVMLITGKSDKFHSCEVMSAALKKAYASEDIFSVETIISSEEESFDPPFGDYDVVVLNINNTSWCDTAKRSFESYVAAGGGVVIIHEADNAFPEWEEYNRIIGLGGWSRRNEKAGPYYYFKDGEYIRDNTPGRAGKHGKRVPFQINVREPKHPIMIGLPSSWTHSHDELYGNLRGPAENIEVLATAYSDSATGGTGKEEPVLFTIRYGKGRIFHSVLGHTTPTFTDAVNNIDFQVTTLRGTEWAATGRVRIKATFEE